MVTRTISTTPIDQTRNPSSLRRGTPQSPPLPLARRVCLHPLLDLNTCKYRSTVSYAWYGSSIYIWQWKTICPAAGCTVVCLRSITYYISKMKVSGGFLLCLRSISCGRYEMRSLGRCKRVYGDTGTHNPFGPNMMRSFADSCQRKYFTPHRNKTIVFDPKTAYVTGQAQSKNSTYTTHKWHAYAAPRWHSH